MSAPLAPYLNGFELLFGRQPAELAVQCDRRPCRHCGQPVPATASATDRCLVCHKPIGKPAR